MLCTKFVQLHSSWEEEFYTCTCMLTIKTCIMHMTSQFLIIRFSILSTTTKIQEVIFRNLIFFINSNKTIFFINNNNKNMALQYQDVDNIILTNLWVVYTYMYIKNPGAVHV